MGLPLSHASEVGESGLKYLSIETRIGYPQETFQEPRTIANDIANMSVLSLSLSGLPGKSGEGIVSGNLPIELHSFRPVKAVDRSYHKT